MDRLDAMRVMVSAIDEGSLAAAARRHGRSPAAATRAVALLEAMAGETLLLRSTRRLSLTTAGERHLAIWREILAKLNESEHRPADIGPPYGTIVVTAPELFGRLKVMPLIEAFLAENRAISARVLMLNRIVDLVGEGVDLAIRLSPLADSSLKAIGLGDVRSLVCASPTYLAKSGIPGQPGDLVDHDCIGLNAQGDRELWSFATPNDSRSRARSVRVGTRLALNSASAAIDAALRGHGIIRAPSYQVADHLAEGRLVRLLPDYEPPPVPVHLVFHPEPAKRGALRAFIDRAAPILRADLARTAAIIRRVPGDVSLS